MPNRTVEDCAGLIVRNDVHLCVSALVSTVALGFGAIIPKDISDLTEQAFELTIPVYDFEEAIVQAGWSRGEAGDEGDWTHPDCCAAYGSAEDCSYSENIEPYQREVFEHWAVSDWLADKLIEKGEKVDKDFANMCVWARTTTGQAIAADSVFKSIAADILNK